jgi:hypothetical protein
MALSFQWLACEISIFNEGFVETIECRNYGGRCTSIETLVNYVVLQIYLNKARYNSCRSGLSETVRSRVGVGVGLAQRGLRQHFYKAFHLRNESASIF